MNALPEVDFDVAVVGAGIAGSITAYQLARSGHSVVLIERGGVPGSKNLSGGVLYTHTLREVFPDYLDSAPFERRVVRNQVSFVNAGSHVTLDYGDERLADPVNAVTVLRGRFDPWLAQRAEAAGAFLMTGVRVDGLLAEPSTDGPAASGEGPGIRVLGVRAGRDELRAHVVVAADGVNSFLARDAGLRPDPGQDELALGVKGVFALPREVIEERFALTGDEGLAWALVGDCTRGIAGGAFCYTNRRSLSVGMVVRLDDLVRRGAHAADVFEHLVHHRVLTPYLAGAELLEYGSHLVAEGGAAMIGDIATDGLVVVGEAAGLALNTGLTVRGMDLAAGSAVCAAQAIGSALQAGDVSRAGLASYRDLLLDSVVGRDMTTYARAPAFLQRDRLYRAYGDVAAGMLADVFRLDGTPRQRLAGIARRRLKASRLRGRDVVADAVAGVRAL